MPEHVFARDSAHCRCVKCLACRTCDPEMTAAPCTENIAWIDADQENGSKP